MEVIIPVLIVVAGSFVQTAIGFGLAVIAAPLLFFIDPAYVPAPITVAALTLSLANAWRFRHSISLAGLKFAILGRVPGTVAGGLLIFWIDQRTLGLWLGISVLVAVWLSFGKVAFRPTRGAMFSAGFLSGFMGTSSSIGGPPMALVLQHQTADFIRANMAAFFVVSCIMSLAMLSFVGRFGEQHILLSLPFMPASLLGYWLAMRSVHLITSRMLRLGSLSLCAVAGLAAVISYWM
ncbi:MAG: sulfite exporter TauE/SafE family protein [Gammaproteobacteria bacterium]|nr:sulfite exporter TauE/SafE family protein [Gammaproteobacteria bacterium]MYA37519.1 sulfite exporter TauE/SafE family protein [Gammaproteobacteria bacterium]MYE30832.1 sulfite exporter TauE/SafE family protein [Gammaproteobacteria bacterium]MYH84612.1 sulfite exporter TauE/SafE family protein [Gammaproteobacteria bacterium]MYK05081.1 sulfite exporter TauE/SafE family protein [Gammaproteobacteria bacterium]